IETGWVGIAPTASAPEPGSTWAVWPGSSGTDRLALSNWLRERGARGRLVRSPSEVSQLLDSGQVQGALMERLSASTVKMSDNFMIFWLPEEIFPQHQMALGFWKGDQTLYRAA